MVTTRLMPKLHIALDVEGVLADTHAATAERSNMLEAEHCPPKDWNFPSDEHYEEFMHVSQNLWHNHNHLIFPTEQEESIGKSVRKLSEYHDVDIVTSRTGVDNQIREWLRGYNIEYDNFIVTDGARVDKTEYGEHDVHIEDSPNVATDALKDGRSVFLIDRPYNPHIGTEYAHNLHRVDSVAEVAQKLYDMEWVTNEKGLVGPVVANG